MKILFNDFKKEYSYRANEFDQAIKRVLKSGYFILGKETEDFEKAFSSYIGTNYAIGVGNGLEALQISLMALGIGQGDEVITTANSAVATALAIQNVGASPIFADIDEYHHINIDSLINQITRRTKAIIPVHLYGQMVDMNKIISFASKYDLKIIEDCAQAHGAEYEGKKAGTFGTIGCFSFYPTKNLGAFGDAGAIVTSDIKLTEKCRMIRNYGQKNRYEHDISGINSRLDEIQSAILSIKLKSLDVNNSRRKQISDLYRKELSSIRQIKLPLERKNSKHVYHLFVIEAEQRDRLQDFLKTKDIPSLIHYPIPIHKQKCFIDHNNIYLPIVEEKVKKILSFPIHPYLTDKEVFYICKQIKLFYAQQ